MQIGSESKNPLRVRRYINTAGVNTWQKLFSTEPARTDTPKERIKEIMRHFVFDTYHTKRARDGQPIKNSFVLGRIPISLSTKFLKSVSNAEIELLPLLKTKRYTPIIPMISTNKNKITFFAFMLFLIFISSKP